MLIWIPVDSDNDKQAQIVPQLEAKKVGIGRF